MAPCALRSRLNMDLNGLKRIQNQTASCLHVLIRNFLATPLASALPVAKPQPINPGWKPNHRFEFPVAIIDPNGHVQVMSGVKLPDGSLKTDFGCWNILTRHFGDATG